MGVIAALEPLADALLADGYELRATQTCLLYTSDAADE